MLHSAALAMHSLHMAKTTMMRWATSRASPHSKDSPGTIQVAVPQHHLRGMETKTCGQQLSAQRVLLEPNAMMRGTPWTHLRGQI